MTMKRPELHKIPINQAVQPGRITATMSRGQWDALLAEVYSAGGILLEVDQHERPVAAYQKPAAPGSQN